MNEHNSFDGLANELENKMKEELLMSELQLLYSEKRTSLSVLRTGIAVLTLPLSVLTVLVATSRAYDILSPNALAFGIPLIIISILLFAFGTVLIYRSFKKIRIYDRKIAKIRKEDVVLDGLVEDRE